MTSGKIAKLVRTFGSRWGRVSPGAGSVEVFFNPASMDEPDDFDALVEGEAVEFEEEFDRTNGSHAVHLRKLAGETSAS